MKPGPAGNPPHYTQPNGRTGKGEKIIKRHISTSISQSGMKRRASTRQKHGNIISSTEAAVAAAESPPVR